MHARNPLRRWKSGGQSCKARAPMRRAIVCLLFVLAALPLLAQKNDDEVLNELFAIRTIHKTAIAPNGKSVAWSVEGSGLFVDGKNLSAKAEEFAWSPDSKQVAYVAERQLYVVTPGTPAKKLTNVKGALADPQW